MNVVKLLVHVFRNPGKCDFFFTYCLFGNWFILINGSRSVYNQYNNEVILVESTYWRTVLKILACWWNNPNQTAESACWTLSGYLRARLDPTTLSKGCRPPMARMDHPKLSGCRGRLQCQRRWSEGWKKVVSRSITKIRGTLPKNDLNSLLKTGSHSLMFAVFAYLPDSLARISFYYPCAVEVVVIWSWISWRQNPSRHCSGDVASTLGCRDTRRNHACSVQQDVNQDVNQATKGKLGILHKY